MVIYLARLKFCWNFILQFELNLYIPVAITFRVSTTTGPFPLSLLLSLLWNHGCSSILQLLFQLITSGSLILSPQCSNLFFMSPIIYLLAFAYLHDSLPEFGHSLLITFAADTQCRSAGFIHSFICNFIPSFNLLKPLVERKVLIFAFARAVGTNMCYRSDKETCLKSITRYN